MSTLSLARDFRYRAPAQTFEVPGVGTLRMHDVGMADAREELLDFYARSYRPGYILGNEALFNWMFKHNGGHVAVLSLGERIIAHQGHVPVVFSDGVSDVRGSISASTMVDGSYRRLGLMTRLRGNVQDRYEMAVSLGGSTRGIALYTSMGYRYLGDLVRLIALVNPERSRAVSQGGERCKPSVPLFRGLSGVEPIERFAALGGELRTLWDRTFPPGSWVGVKRDAGILHWRYREHPLFAYQRFGLRRHGALSAVVVFRKERVSGSIANVIRLVEGFGEREALIEQVRGTVLSEAVAHDVAWVDWFCSNRTLCGHLAAAGFQTPEELAPARFPIFTSPVDYYKTTYPFMFWSADERRYEPLPPFSEWYITKGDGDADRPNDATGRHD